MLRNRLLTGATALTVKVLYLTVRFDIQGWERAKLEAWHGPGAIFAFWHNSLMVPLGHESRKGVKAFISSGPDGEYAARVVRSFGIGAVRGSSSRAGSAALLEAIRRSEGNGRFAVTPDGPRGPRYQFQHGTAFLASRSGIPIVPIGIALSRAWKLRSWDRFRIPKPFGRAVMIFGPPIHLSSELDREAVEEARGDLERELHRLSREAAVRAGVAWPD